MKPLKKKRGRNNIIKPTEKPSPQEMILVAMDVVNTVQKLILSPSAVIATLSCALDLYVKNVIAKGFDNETATQCVNLGVDMAEMIRQKGLVKSGAPPETDDDEEPSPIINPVGGLVDVHGNPL